MEFVNQYKEYEADINVGYKLFDEMQYSKTKSIEEIVIDSLHESIPGTNFTKHATLDFVNPTINQFESFQKEIQQRLGVDITELNFPYWETVNDIVEDIRKEIKHER